MREAEADSRYPLIFQGHCRLAGITSPLFAVAIALRIHSFRFDYHELGGCALYEVPNYECLWRTL